MGELMQAMAGVKLEHIPYRGGADAARDLAAGRIDAVFISESSLRPVLESGKAKPIGITGTTRRPNLPEVPAIAELLPGYDLSTWIMVFAPAGTPEAVQQRLAAAFRAATTDAAIRARLEATGVDPVVATPAEARALFARDKAVLGRLSQNDRGRRP
jgi:tripartite-type tricarboxylate transporter receptor subunit TctC